MIFVFVQIGCTGENGKDFVGSQGFIYDMNNVKPTCNELDDDLIKKHFRFLFAWILYIGNC